MTSLPELPAGVTFVNAQFSGGDIGSLRVLGSRIDQVGGAPKTDDLVVDLKGDWLLPGLINAHDHLQLNSLPSSPSVGYYRHARDWISDVDARRRTDSKFAASVLVARDDRLLIGAVKNLLSGVTTVAHHDPLYPFLRSGTFPISVLREYGWAHSLYIDGEERVVDSYRSTPSHWPWIVHAAEGLNDEAANEFERLDALGCVKTNTLIVHGIALDRSQRARLIRAGAALIWCPSSNMHLFDKTAEIAELVEHKRVALGTDSRLSGARDLLEELRLVAQCGGLSEQALVSLVTSDSARLLRLDDRGALRPGLRADLVSLPAARGLAVASRADVRLVIVAGLIRYGDRDRIECAAPYGEWVDVLVDGRHKVLEGRIARILSEARASEPGLEISTVAWRVA